MDDVAFVTHVYYSSGLFYAIARAYDLLITKKLSKEKNLQTSRLEPFKEIKLDYSTYNTHDAADGPTLHYIGKLYYI